MPLSIMADALAPPAASADGIQPVQASGGKYDKTWVKDEDMVKVNTDVLFFFLHVFMCCSDRLLR